MSHASHRCLALVLLAFVSMAGCQAKSEKPIAGAPEPPAVQAPTSRSGDKALEKARAIPADFTRKVVYKAELSVEVRSPADAQSRVTALVEREGGYVASAAQSVSEASSTDVTLVLRVPAERFSAVLADIRRLGDGKRAERIDSEDVTDEVVDLDARLRAQTRLEEQLLELLKTATTVEAALNVHKELGNVRTEIERIQGRKQVLDREVAMSTIKLVLAAPPVDAVSFSKLGHNVSEATSDAILVAGGIVVVAIRMTGVLLPILLMLGVPVLLAFLAVRKRALRKRAALAAAASS